VHRLAPLGMLLASAVLSTLGLWAMSQAHGLALFGAATLFAFGVCFFFWPTMLGYVSGTLPKTGALGLAIMAGPAMLSLAGVAHHGRCYDAGIAARQGMGSVSGKSRRHQVWETLGRVDCCHSVAGFSSCCFWSPGVSRWGKGLKAEGTGRTRLSAFNRHPCNRGDRRTEDAA